MKGIDFTDLLTCTRSYWKRHLSEILTGFGIGGSILAIFETGEATVKAVKRVAQKKEELHTDKLTPKETVAVAWKYYIPAAITEGLSISCLFGASSVNAKRNAALMTAYSITEATLKDYRQEVIKSLGERKEEAVRTEVDKKRVTEDPPTPEDIDIITRTGKTLCMDGTFGGYFYSDIETIRKAANRLNCAMKTMAEPYVSLNDFNAEIDHDPVDAGNILGWNIAMDGCSGQSDGPIRLYFSSQLVKGIPVLVMTHANMPKYDYDAF